MKRFYRAVTCADIIECDLNLPVRDLETRADSDILVTLTAHIVRPCLRQEDICWECNVEVVAVREI